MVGWLCVRVHVQEKQEQGQGQENTKKKKKRKKKVRHKTQVGARPSVNGHTILNTQGLVSSPKSKQDRVSLVP